MGGATSDGRFSASELLPRSGSPRPERTPERKSAFPAWHGRLRSIYIHNPNHVAVFEALDLVMSAGVKGVHQTGVRNAAESYAGKSASADEFARIVARRGTHPPDARPVVRVELEQACTSKRFWAKILSAYGDGFARSKDEEALRRSAYEAFEKHGTELLIIDEVQHAGYRSAGSSAPTDVIKRFISDAQVGLGLFGNEEARTLLEGNNQLSHRLLPPCDIRPLDLAIPKDRAQFVKFVRRYDAALMAQGLFAVSSDLVETRTVDCLMAMSRGYLGRVVTAVQIAAQHAYWRGAEAVEPFDLSYACTAWAVAQGLIGTDPFRFGTDALRG